MRVWTLIGWIVLAGIAAGQERVVLRSGLVHVGQIKTGDGLLRIATADGRHVYLTSTLATARTPATAEAAEPVPTYTFNQALVKRPKKGVIDVVPHKTEWGQWTMDGHLPTKMLDPKLGWVEFTMVISQITPLTARMEGVEYRKSFEMPLPQIGPLAHRLVSQAVDPADPAALLKVARFYRLAGDAARARGWLARLARAAPKHPGLATEEAALSRDTIVKQLTELRRLAWLGASTEAAALAREIVVPEALATVDGPLAAEATSLIERVTKTETQRAEVAAWLDKAELKPAAPITVDQARRLHRILRIDGEPRTVGPAQLPWLSQAWTEAIDPQIADADLAQLVKLAQVVAAFYATPDRKGLSTLARQLARARLSTTIKVAILRHAVQFDEPAERKNRWRKVEFKHPKTRTSYHYYVQIPTSYRPDVPAPVMLALHGQTSTADMMKHVWSAIAEAQGIVLISPEYIYGRKWGYQFGSKEHRAVLGALWHAAGELNLDPTRVYLTGQSQGGHASWDIGSAQADRFAGVIPVIGCPLNHRAHRNLVHTALYCIDGSKDGAAPVYNRAAIAALAKHGADATYVEYQGRGHDGFGEEYWRVVRWLQSRRRDPAERRIELHAYRVTDHRRRYVELLATRPALPGSSDQTVKARVSGTIKDNRVALRTSGVTRMAIWIDPAVMDVADTLVIEVNGQRRYAGKVRLDWRVALEDAHRRRDRGQIFLGRIGVPGR